MNISNETLEILKNYVSINTSLVVNPGNKLVTNTPEKTMLVVASVSEIFEVPFAIYDLSQFLGVLSTMTSPELEFLDNQVIVTSGKFKAKYAYAAPELCPVNPNVTSINANYSLSFTMKSEVIPKVIRTSSIFKFDSIGIAGEDGQIVVKGLSREGVTKNTYSVEMEQETDRTFNMIIPLERFAKLLPLEYQVSVAPTGQIMFKHDRITYWYVVDTKSNKGNL